MPPRHLILMVKEPRPGRVKTRLARDIGRIDATWWFRHQLARTLRAVQDPRWTTWIAVAPDTALTARVWPSHLPRLPQGSGDLGARMARLLRSVPPSVRTKAESLPKRRVCAMPDLGRAPPQALASVLQSPIVTNTSGRSTNALPGGRSGMAHTRRLVRWGYGARHSGGVNLSPGPTCIVGADIPGMTRHHIARAFAALGHSDAVFGPAEDGGYWLVGLARTASVPATLFQDVRWSSPHALADSMASLPGRRIALADTLRDVDTAADLPRRPWKAMYKPANRPLPLCTKGSKPA